MSLDASARGASRSLTAMLPISQPAPGVLGRFVSLHEVFAALRRRRRVVVGLASVGAVLSLAVIVALPASRSAVVTLYLTHPSGDDPNIDMSTDVALLQTEAVAQMAVEHYRLGLGAATLENAYHGTANGVSILDVTATGPSAAVAVQRANAVAHAFLTVRTRLFEAQNNATVRVLSAEIDQLQQQVNQLANLGSGTSPLSSAVVEQRSLDLTQIADIEQTVQIDTVNTTSVVDTSTVLVTATPVKTSHLKGPLLDVLAGMMTGAALGAGIVVLQAIISDRIRRREDFAVALGLPVALSVGRIRVPRVAWVPLARRSLRTPDRSLQLLVRYLRSHLSAGPTSRSLAVVSIDSPKPAALAVTVLARHLAREGLPVLMVDLSSGSLLGRMFGVDRHHSQPRPVEAVGPSVRLLVPDRESVSPLLAPLGQEHAVAQSNREWSERDSGVVLVLVTVDPVGGIGKVSEWADRGVVVVTAGTTSAARARALSEAARASGLMLESAVLTGADDNDDSPGTLAFTDGASQSDEQRFAASRGNRGWARP